MNLLIASGADIHHLDQDGRSSLGLACLAGNEEIVKCFLEKGKKLSYNSYIIFTMLFFDLQLKKVFEFYISVQMVAAMTTCS